MDGQKTKILFLGTDNSCRTQIAEGWVKHLKSDYLEPYSAGIEPRNALDPLAVKVMAEAGVDISQQQSKHVYDLRVIFDFYIIVCTHATESIPLFPGSASVTFVCFDDPPVIASAFDTENEKLDCYRSVRNKIKKLIKTFPEALEKH